MSPVAQDHLGQERLNSPEMRLDIDVEGATSEATYDRVCQDHEWNRAARTHARMSSSAEWRIDFARTTPALLTSTDLGVFDQSRAYPIPVYLDPYGWPISRCIRSATLKICSQLLKSTLKNLTLGSVAAFRSEVEGRAWCKCTPL